ncbi:IS4 family transposase [Streptomyces sp. KMM 9044]|uniref:IS4 family transposase n=1 Tax=Streptomyces sp. KMM 9044 TaxID=2744474 RepID=UPI00215199C4|nr:IS4 family transposase [Streptomyces sp. KMM 9044]WAX81626.1 IS4 family transposase [Streptomyces sp. KMM 9044]
MRLHSAITSITRTITVAAGVFAPGHLGGLTQFIPFELVDAILDETGRGERRLRLLPSRVGVYYVLALALFPELSCIGVWQQLAASTGPLAPKVSGTALRHLRRRLTPAPFKTLFETLAVPLAPPTTPGVSYRHWRTVAFDGCSSIKAPDSERARGWLGKVRYRLAWAGYPTVMLMTLVETGTRGLLGACFGPTSTGETTYATRLLPLLNTSHLVLVDRGFDSNAFLAGVAGTGAQFVARLKSTRRPPLVRPLADGSYLARLGTLTVRIIEADLLVRLADGTTAGGRYRLATTLLDPAADPAIRLVRLYTERWEIESAYFALRATLMKGRVLRSRDRFGIEQELWAALTAYQVLRTAMTEAAVSAGADPDRTSFTHALTAARAQITLAEGVTGTPEAIITAVTDNLLPPRRHRISARKVKSPISRYHSWHGQARPTTSTPVESVEITLHDRSDATAGTAPDNANHPTPAETCKPDPTPADTSQAAEDPGGRFQLALAIMNSSPDRPSRPRRSCVMSGPVVVGQMP